MHSKARILRRLWKKFAQTCVCVSAAFKNSDVPLVRIKMDTQISDEINFQNLGNEENIPIKIYRWARGMKTNRQCNFLTSTTSRKTVLKESQQVLCEILYEKQGGE